jgi:hypothetical protein
MESLPREPDPALRKLYPNFSNEELLLAEKKLGEYFEFTLRLYRRIVSDPEAYRRFKILTADKDQFIIETERSQKHNDSSQS